MNCGKIHGTHNRFSKNIKCLVSNGGPERYKSKVNVFFFACLPSFVAKTKRSSQNDCNRLPSDRYTKKTRFF